MTSSENYLLQLQEVDSALHSDLLNAINAAGEIQEDIQGRWEKLCIGHDLIHEKPILNARYGDSKDTSKEDHETRVRGFAQAHLNIPHKKWDRLCDTLINYPLEFWPFIVDTKPCFVEHDEWKNYVQPGSYRTETNKFGATRHAAYFPKRRELQAAKLAEIKEGLIRGFNNAARGGTPNVVDCSVNGFLSLHEHLAREVYNSAGHVRSIDIGHCDGFGNQSINPNDPNIDYKGLQAKYGEMTVHCPVGEVLTRTQEVFHLLRRQLYDTNGHSIIRSLPTDQRIVAFAQAAAPAYVELNCEIHPSYSMGGVASKPYFMGLAMSHGLMVDWMATGDSKWRKKAGQHFLKTGEMDPAIQGMRACLSEFQGKMPDIRIAP